MLKTNLFFNNSHFYFLSKNTVAAAAATAAARVVATGPAAAVAIACKNGGFPEDGTVYGVRVGETTEKGERRDR